MLGSHPGPRGGDAPAATDRSELVGEIRALQARLAALTEQVGRNDSLLRKTQERELELLRAGSLSQLFERLIAGLRSSYQLDDVALILHDPQHEIRHLLSGDGLALEQLPRVCFVDALTTVAPQLVNLDRKSTRLNSSHTVISYAVFCLKKKKKHKKDNTKQKN